ncbi:RhoGAP-domain-containing protein [Coprinellus micaceus]|uniref:RhoGAP-domain-containing protein n=1 Tax=Coprinellus micaceus TaxID=71717 RepID=A0A4Y7TRF6_COPMI|nr:RhoGAP-domain-containing protein [Coprinellus micaceus]
MQGPFVRALQTVFHLNCFKCLDCGEVVASKFFPIEGPDGKQSPLCERDYFRRLGLICAKCDMALRGSYITACNKKFHVEHFTCSVCTTLFGPQDSYYEHDGDVYCHFHYSTRFATKCAGCNSAILKQFVEINRNSRDECWHPECYMINKFWNVKVASRRPSSTASSITSPDLLSSPTSPTPDSPIPQSFREEEAQETPASLREKQSRMEQLVYRIWTVLSAFEESDMLRQVSNGAYLDAIRMAEKFILHVEVLFATIDDLEFQFSQIRHKGMQHVREARMLCRKTVELFTLLSHTQETGARRMGMTQELLALVTGLAHYLKILIRIALTGALKLERDYVLREAISSFLDKLHLLAVQGANPTARRIIRGSNGEVLHPNPGSGNYGTQCVTYGFRSLAPENAGESPFSPGAHSNGEGNGTVISSNNPPSDLCAKCGTTVEEDCVRLGTYQRWHSHCIACVTCGKVAAVPLPKETKEIALASSKSGDERDPSSSKDPSQSSKPSTQRRPPANVAQFVYDPSSLQTTPSFGDVPTRVYCLDHAHQGCRGGFQPVQRLEQYAFLLNVALRRLYLLLRKQGVVPAIIPSGTLDSSNPQGVRMPADMSDPYRNSSERMKSVYLDRKLSATARVAKRSTIVEGPSSDAVTIGSTSYAQASTTTPTPPHTQYQGSSSSLSQSTVTSSTSASQGQYQPSQRQDPYPQHLPPPSPKQQQPPAQASTLGQAAYRPSQQQGPSAPRGNIKMLEPLERSALPGHHGTNAAYYAEDPHAAGQQYQQQQQQPPYPPSQQQLYQPQPQHYQNQQYAPQQQQYQYSQQQLYHQPPPPSSSTYAPRGTPAQQRGPGNGGSPGGDGITLADIPSLMEAAQAREQHRSLPRESSIPYISELSPLELAIVRHSAVLALVKSPLKDSFDLDEILEMVEAKKNTFWNKLFNKGEKGLKNVKKKGVFGVPLELLAEREGADSMLGAARVTIRVPSFIDDVISAMRTMDMSVEGIFRKNGNIRRLKDLTEALDRDPSSVDLTQDNPVQLAALLKKFLRDLPDPLMTFKLHRLLIASQSVVQDDEERKRYLHLISLIMPKSHRDTMEVLFVFLKWVASFAHMDAETGSKMDLGNLATVIGPSILYSRGRDALRDETFGSLRVVTSLLENQDEFFLVPQDMLPILQDQEYFANALELPSKEFMKKVDMYLKVKGQGGRNQGSTTPYLGGGSAGQSGPANGSSAPRFAGSVPAPLPSPTMERPPPLGGDRSGRPSPNTTPHPQQGPPSTSNHGHGGNGGGYFAGAAGPPTNDYQHSSGPGSPSLQHRVPQGLQQQQRTPPMASADWSQPPRSNSGGGTPSGSRPVSVAGNPPSRSFNAAAPPSSSYTNVGPLSSSPMESGMYASPPANGYHPNAALRPR